MEPFWLGVFGVALFALSASASAIYHGRMRRCAQPAPGTQLTLRSGGAHLRCRFISARRGKWVVTPLTIVGAVCPTRLTGDMIARFGTAAGVVVFATRVVGAD
ncbi:MAG: hypothetical protein C4340_05110, partial [Armatimonadota bacterium]